MNCNIRKTLIPLVAMWMATSAFAAGPPATVTVTASPSTLPANGNTFSELVAVVKDSSGVAVDDGTQVTWSSSSLGVITPLTSTTTGGVAKAKLRAPVNTGSSTITATTTGSINGTKLVSFVGTAAKIEFIQSFANYYLPSDSSAQARVMAKVYDTDNNPVADGTRVDFTADYGSVVSPAYTVGGVVSTTITSPSSTTSEEGSVFAISGDATGEMPISVGPGPWSPDAYPARRSILADGTSQVVVTGMLFNHDGILSKDGTPLTFTMGTNEGTIISPAYTVGGDAQTVLTSAAAPGVATISVSDGSTTNTSPIVYAGPASRIIVYSSMAAIHPGTNNGVKVYAVVNDELRNPVADGTVVNFAITSGTGSIDSKSIVENGKATVTFFASDSVDTAMVTATCGSASGAGAVFVAGAPATITVVPELYSVPSDGSSTCRLAITVLDSGGRPVPDDTILTVTKPTGVNGTSVISTASGNAQAVVVAPASPSSATITVSKDSVSGMATVVFAGTAAGVTLSATPAAIPAGDGAETLITANVVDSGNRPVADGTQVTFSTNRGSFSQASGATTVNATTVGGVATARLVAGTQGTATVTLTCGGVNNTTTVTFD